jgi:hypothetical protein
LHEADVDFTGRDQIDSAQCTRAILNIDGEVIFFQPSLGLREMQRRMHAPGREIDAHGQFICSLRTRKSGASDER